MGRLKTSITTTTICKDIIQRACCVVTDNFQPLQRSDHDHERDYEHDNYHYHYLDHNSDKQQLHERACGAVTDNLRPRQRSDPDNCRYHNKHQRHKLACWVATGNLRPRQRPLQRPLSLDLEIPEINKSTLCSMCTSNIASK